MNEKDGPFWKAMRQDPREGQELLEANPSQAELPCGQRSNSGEGEGVLELG